MHHAAHGLPVGDAAVQVLHPAFEWFTFLALPLALALPLPDGCNALGHAFHAAGFFGRVEGRVFQRGVDIQQTGGHFHGQRRAGNGTGVLGLHDRGLQLGGQHVARSEQTLQRITDQTELLGQAAKAVHFTAGHRRPRLFGRRHALACLGDPGRVKATQRGRGVVGRHVVHQAVGLARRTQPCSRFASSRRAGLGAEKQQVLRQTLRHFGGALVSVSVGDQTQLRQQARGHALAEQVGLQQAHALRFEHRSRQLPQSGRSRIGRHAQVTGVGPCAQARAHIAQALRDGLGGAAHQAQQASLNQRDRFGIGLHRSSQRVAGQHLPVPVQHPQVGGVRPVGTGRVLHRLVLREQRKC